MIGLCPRLASRVFSPRGYSRGRGESKSAASDVLRILVFLCCTVCVVHSSGDLWRHKLAKDKRGKLSSPKPQPHLGYCDFEESCDWVRNETTGFRVSTAVADVPGLRSDASGIANGNCVHWGQFRVIPNSKSEYQSNLTDGQSNLTDSIEQNAAKGRAHRFFF